LATCNSAPRSARPFRHPLLAGVTLLSIAATPGCTRIDDALASVPTFAFMRNSPAFDPYEHPLPPAPGSVPFQSPNGPVLPPLEATEQALQAFAAGPWGQNPLAADDPSALALGRVMYDRHCAVCHGAQGGGDGPLVGEGKYPQGFVPSLVVAPATTLSDGYIYAVVRAGRGRMPAYGTRMTHTERWAVVTYMNSLQTAAGAVQPSPVQQSPMAPQDATGAAPAPTAAPAPAAGAVPDTVPLQQ
jgi:mono/diheme cytochrome c family protein